MSDTVLIDGINYGLSDLEKDCWIRLLNGTVKAKDAMHTAYVANQGKEGINLRTVVLRKVDTRMKTLCFHTDNRSGKWKELTESPQVSWLFYDASARVQIRAAGSASLFTQDDKTNEAWQKLNANSRKTYMGICPPSELINLPSSGLDPKFNGNTPTLQETEFAKDYFGIVEIKVNWMEWLWLSSSGHRRARFDYKNEEGFEASWITP